MAQRADVQSNESEIGRNKDRGHAEDRNRTSGQNEAHGASDQEHPAPVSVYALILSALDPCRTKSEIGWSRPPKPEQKNGQKKKRCDAMPRVEIALAQVSQKRQKSDAA